MTQQRRTRPTRADRARQKTRIPNIPLERGPVEREFAPNPPSEQAPPWAAGPVSFARTSHRAAPAVVQDYAYVRADLTRISVVSAGLLALLIVLALILR